ncbi:hypothetical protein VAE308_230001 [Vibrio aestuarianus]|uniref:Uncharacterized protein n=1 Tax=Vibrio aestuarianus TaxID=28171 RepID=A0ABM9FL82_9VIBR|nr:hypothetical protein VAE063_650006 [Vibrio aestuarianus]CAH8232958.1 hypothetical protein VAE308_230001 [Vibrio aestuarianus]
MLGVFLTETELGNKAFLSVNELHNGLFNSIWAVAFHSCTPLSSIVTN